MFINEQAGLVEDVLDEEFCGAMVDNTLDFYYDHKKSFGDADVFMFGDYNADMMFCGC